MKKTLLTALAAATALTAQARIDEAQFNDNFDLHLDTESKVISLAPKTSGISGNFDLLTLPSSMQPAGISDAYQEDGKSYANIVETDGDMYKVQLQQNEQISLSYVGNVGASPVIDYSGNATRGTILTSAGHIWTLNGSNLGDGYATSTSPVSTTPTFTEGGDLDKLVLNFEDGSSQTFNEPSATPEIYSMKITSEGLVINAAPLHTYTIEKNVGDLNFDNPSTTTSYSVTLDDASSTIPFKDSRIGGSELGTGIDGKDNKAAFYRAKY